jgi:hypothetical protein
MALTAGQAIARAQRTFPELDDTVALELLNDEWAYLAAKYNLKDDEIWQALTEDDSEIALAETVARIQRVHLYTGADISTPLRFQAESELDTYTPNWRVEDSGTPKFYTLGAEGSTDTGVRTLGLYPKPNATTLTINDATNATPIVITTTTDHGLSDGDQVRCVNVGGNTNANTLAYAKVTGYSTTTFALYSDEDLTTAIAGNAAYTSGGSVITGDSPALRIFVHRSSVFVSGSSLPNLGPHSDIFVFGICWRYAREIRDTELVSRERALYLGAIKEFEEYRCLQAEGAGVMILPYHYVPRRVI